MTFTEGISLFNSTYKVFSKVVLNRIVLYVEDCLGDYQYGFRKSRSTREQLFTIGQLIEKKYEFWENMWQTFIDFKKVYDSIHRESITLRILKRVRTQHVTSGTFISRNGVKAGRRPITSTLQSCPREGSKDAIRKCRLIIN